LTKESWENPSAPGGLYLKEEKRGFQNLGRKTTRGFVKGVPLFAGGGKRRQL